MKKITFADFLDQKSKIGILWFSRHITSCRDWSIELKNHSLLSGLIQSTKFVLRPTVIRYTLISGFLSSSYGWKRGLLESCYENVGTRLGRVFCCLAAYYVESQLSFLSQKKIFLFPILFFYITSVYINHILCMCKVDLFQLVMWMIKSECKKNEI